MMNSTSIAKALELLNNGDAAELRELLEKELYISKANNATSTKQRISALNNILKEAEKTSNPTIKGMFTISDHNYVCDGYRAIRTSHTYPVKRIDEGLKPFKVNELFRPFEAMQPVKIDVAQLKTERAKKTEYVSVNETNFSVKYLSDMVTFFETDIVYLGESALNAAQLKNNNGEEGIILPVKIRDTELKPLNIAV